MSRDGFRSDDVINRRVNRHISSLLPDQISPQKDYHFEGQRVLDSSETPGAADSCLCYLETYVGKDGQFEIEENRRFDYNTDAEWQCTNRIARTTSGRNRSGDPFEYTVRTTLTLADQQRSDRSRVGWEALGDDPIFGGAEAQAATLLAEKMAHRKVSESGRRSDHHGSLSYLGSLSNVIDSGQLLPVDWTDVDALLGPEAETIAAATGFERLEADDKRREATQKGIDFLSDTLDTDMAEFEGSLKTDGDPATDTNGEPWKQLPSDMDETTAKAKITEMREELQELINEY